MSDHGHADSHHDHHHDHHHESHFTSSEIVRDVVIGMSDGLTVPFALAAGVVQVAASTLHPGALVVTAGLAEIAAGSIAMGLGGYLAARTQAEHYTLELAREYRETVEFPDVEREEVAIVFRSYGLDEKVVDTVVDAIAADQKRWVDFMMKFELGLEEPDPKRARNSAAVIAVSYIVGGLVPLSPYMVVESVHNALYVSVGVTTLALLIFGYIKGRFTVAKPWRSAWQTALVGSLAAGAAFVIARLVGG